MNDLQLYCFLMFWAGVLLTRLIFHVEKKWAEKETYNEFSVSLIKFLWVICFLEQSKQAENPDWKGALLPIGVVIFFIVMLIMFSRG